MTKTTICTKDSYLLQFPTENLNVEFQVQSGQLLQTFFLRKSRGVSVKSK